MAGRKARADRRDRDRPLPGDVQLCPFCRVGAMAVDEQYAPAGRVEPAWVCSNPRCGYRRFLRKAGDVVRSNQETIAHARRKAMKARAQTDRATRQVLRINALIKKKS
jgi:hypothetical protein